MDNMTHEQRHRCTARGATRCLRKKREWLQKKPLIHECQEGVPKCNIATLYVAEVSGLRISHYP